MSRPSICFVFLVMFDFIFYAAGPWDTAERHLGRRRFIIELDPAGYAALSYEDDVGLPSRDCILFHESSTLPTENRLVCSFDPRHNLI